MDSPAWRAAEAGILREGRRAAAGEQRAFRVRCGKQKLGVVSPHVQVVRLAVKFLLDAGISVTARKVLALLRFEVPDEVRDGILPVLLRAEADVPPGVEFDQRTQTVHFHFENRNSAPMTWRTFRNQVHAAKKFAASGE